jgi:transposase
MMNLLIGIDWGQEHHHVYFMNPNGAQLASFEIAHAAEGFAELDDKRAKLGVPPTECLVAVETAHNLLVDFLWSRQYIVYVIATTVVKGSRGRITNSGASSDARSAYLLADLLRTERKRFLPWLPDTPLIWQMRAKLSLIEALRRDINRWSNRLRAVLLRYYPQMVGLFSKLTTQIGLQCISAYPTPQVIAELDTEAWTCFCRQHRYTRMDRITETYASLQAPVPQAAPAAVCAYQGEAVFLARLLLSMVQRRAQEIRELGALFKQHPDHAIFASLPGARDLLGPSLLVKFGDHRERFPSPAGPQALAGTCPITVSSGKSKHVFFRRSCDRDFRRIVHQFAMASCRKSFWAQMYWREVYARSGRKNHAYRCLANRWLAIIWKLWYTRQPYDEQYHLRQRQLRRKPRNTKS